MYCNHAQLRKCIVPFSVAHMYMYNALATTETANTSLKTTIFSHFAYIQLPQPSLELGSLHTVKLGF